MSYSASHVVGKLTRWKPGCSLQAGEKQMAQEEKKPESQKAGSRHTSSLPGSGARAMRAPEAVPALCPCSVIKDGMQVTCRLEV